MTSCEDSRTCAAGHPRGSAAVFTGAYAGPGSMFGGTVAHGFLSLSLLSRMAFDVMLVPDNLKMAVNYGFDSIRFLAPVPAGARVRGIFTLTNVEEKSLGQLLVHHNVMVDIDVTEKPALTADWLSLLIL